MPSAVKLRWGKSARRGGRRQEGDRRAGACRPRRTRLGEASRDPAQAEWERRIVSGRRAAAYRHEPRGAIALGEPPLAEAHAGRRDAPPTSPRLG
jgi:hypothetical protein